MNSQFRALFSVLICFMLLLPMALAPLPAGAQNPSSVELRTISFNIRYPNPDDGIHYWDNRKANVIRLLNYYEADLVGLQEVTYPQVQALEEALTDYEWIGIGRTDGKQEGEYTPIFYRKDRLSLLEHDTFWLSETPADTGSVGWDASLPRIVTWAHFRENASGREFFHFNTHFDHRGERARKESATLLAQKITEIAEEAPVVITGDFNFTDRTDAYLNLTQENRRTAMQNEDRLLDARNIAELSNTGSEGTSGGFTTAEHGDRRIDYIFVKNGVQVRYFATLMDNWLGRFPSDHRPVLADIFY